MKTLFGKPETQTPSQSQSGFSALPVDLQNMFRNLSTNISGLSPDAFRPIDLTQEELTAQGMINPENIGMNIQKYLNPYRDIVISDINKQFEAPQGALASQISEAGAFGGSRSRNAAADLERARLDAIANAMSGQYNTAFQNMQSGIGNLLGFGGLERQIELGQSTAPYTAYTQIMNALAPLLGGSVSTGEGKIGATGGLVGDAQKLANLVGSIGGMFKTPTPGAA